MAPPHSGRQPAIVQASTLSRQQGIDLKSSGHKEGAKAEQFNATFYFFHQESDINRKIALFIHWQFMMFKCSWCRSHKKLFTPSPSPDAVLANADLLMNFNSEY